MQEFSCHTYADGPVMIVEVAGDVDLAVGPDLWNAIEPLLVPGANVVIDCSRITFFDSTGLRVVIQANQQADRVGAVFGLAAAPTSVSQVLKLSGVDSLIQTHASLAEALPTA